MCGIVGIHQVAPRVDLRARLESGAERLIHRGPDDLGIYAGDVSGLAMRRLSINGLEDGEQPIRSEDGRFVLVGNGEIYNSPALRRELESRGHVFRGHSDMEPVVHRFEEIGAGVFAELNGMFAIAILDTVENQIVVARDRLGIKPLFVAERDGAWSFGSEVAAVRALIGNPAPSVSVPAIEAFLEFGYLIGESTWDDSIRRLPPGSTLTIDSAGARTANWWTLPEFDPDPSRSVASFGDELADLIEDSIRLRTLSDVEIGVFLSGGADSTTIAAVLRRALEREFPVFTLRVGDGFYDETADARETAEALGVEHHIETLAIPTPDELDDLFAGFGEPFADTSLLPTSRVSELASRRVKVCLSGDGADELFAGYPWLHMERRLRALPGPVQALSRLAAPVWPFRRGRGTLGRIGRMLGDLAGTPHESFLRRRTVAPATTRAQLLHRSRRGFTSKMPTPRDLDPSGAPDIWSHLLDLDRRFFLAGDILAKVDRASMRHSLEARVPLLDHRIVEFAARIPTELHFDDRGGGKAVLEHATRKLVPPGLFDRPKRGFGLPVGSWMREPLSEPVRERLLSRELRELELFEPSALEHVIDEHMSGRADRGHLLWALWSCAICLTREDSVVPGYAPAGAR